MNVYFVASDLSLAVLTARRLRGELWTPPLDPLNRRALQSLIAETPNAFPPSQSHQPAPPLIEEVTSHG